MTAALVPIVSAQTENMEMFYQGEFLGLKIEVNATREAEPGENITVTMLVESLAKNVKIKYLYFNFFGFVDGETKIPLINFPLVEEETPLEPEDVITENCTVSIPKNVWGVIYGELFLEQSQGLVSIEIPHIGFTMTKVKNVMMEQLKGQLEDLNKTYKQLKENYTRLNEQLQSLQENYTQLNETYVALNQTYWELKESVGGLETTRNVMFIFLATTVTFAATTAYLFLRRPKRWM